MDAQSTYALTIFQPWPSLIMIGAKPYEFRSWNYTEKGFLHMLGQRIVIHAAAREIKEETIDEAIEQLTRQEGIGIINTAQLRKGIAMLIDWPGNSDKMPIAAALGTAIIGSPVKPLEWDNYGWPMKDPVPFEKPIPAKGSQGFWVWEAPPVEGGRNCPATGCASIIGREFAFCYRHWMCVSRKLQKEIYAAWKTDRTAHAFAIKQAIGEIARFEGVAMEKIDA